jgi:hypothetical protein
LSLFQARHPFGAPRKAYDYLCVVRETMPTHPCVVVGGMQERRYVMPRWRNKRTIMCIMQGL